MSDVMAMEYAQGLADTLREEWANGSGYDYMDRAWDSVLDYRYTKNASGDLVGVSLLVTFGGPNAWLEFDGRGCEVQASWYSDTQRVYVPCGDLSAGVLEYFEEVVPVG